MEELANITKLRQRTSRRKCRRKNRKKCFFLKFGREGMKSSRKYQNWLTQDCSLFSKTEQNIDGEKKRDFEDTNNQILLTRERSSGRNIFDAEKTVISKHQAAVSCNVFRNTGALICSSGWVSSRMSLAPSWLNMASSSRDSSRTSRGSARSGCGSHPAGAPLSLLVTSPGPLFDTFT